MGLKFEYPDYRGYGDAGIPPTIVIDGKGILNSTMQDKY
jgi:hypothetical protein